MDHDAMTYEDILTRNQQRFIMRRRKLGRAWRVTGPLVLLLLIVAGVLLFFNYPLMFNPYESMARLEAGTLEDTTVLLMALLLPAAMVMVFVMLVVVVLMVFAVIANDRKYLTIIQDLQDAHDSRSGPA